MQQKNSNDSSVDKDIDALAVRALQHYQEGRLEQAQEVCQQILRKQQRPDALLILGMIAHEQRDFEAAVGRYEQFLKLVPDSGKTHFQLGVVLEELGRTERAIEHFEISIGISANNADVHRRLGDAYSKLRRWEEAIEAYRKSLAIKAEDVVTTIKLGNAFNAAERWPEAIPPFEQALAILPDNAKVHRHLGAALHKTGQTNKAIQCFERALRLRPDYAGALVDFALVLRRLGRADEALVQLEQVLDLKPDDADAQINRALTLRQLGQTELAVERLEQFIVAKPGSGETYYHLSMMKPEQSLKPVIDKLLSDPELPNDDAIFCHFSLGNLCNDNSSFDQAFSHFLKANTLFRKTYAYDPKENVLFIDNLIKVYSKRFFQNKGNFGSASQLPVFIVGMPRSGTTLIEQILSSHSLVHGAGEIGTVPAINISIAEQLKHASPRLAPMTHVDKKMSEKYSALYLRELALHSTSAQRITDKLPENFARIGLIKILFPDARIIHCQRNPLDNCISLFFHCFMAFKASFELTELGQYYLQYQRLMSHWHKLFPGEIFDVQYEELVTDQEKVSKQLVDYIGLEWDEKCMDFHTSERPVMSPSSIQVRQPMYKTSIDRWKHYEKQIRPLIEVLQQAH